MPLPALLPTGYLPPGIHAATLREVQERFGAGSNVRRRQRDLLQHVVNAAHEYASIKRVLVWGSFVSSKLEPEDLDYSLIVSIEHGRTDVQRGHRRFLVPADARRYYGVDRSYLVIKDYPLDVYAERLDFICRNREQVPRGIVEISLWGEFLWEAT